MKKEMQASLETIPLDIFVHILSFISPQEKITKLQELRILSKTLNAIINSDKFLQLHAPSLFLMKQIKEKKISKNFLKTDTIIDEQIQDWSNLKTKVDKIFSEFYTNLPQIKPVVNLLKEIRNTPLPLSYYFSAFRNILCSRSNLVILVFLLLLVTAAIIYSVVQLPTVQPIKAERMKVQQELENEGCTFGAARHGAIYIENCNDTVKADAWRSLVYQETGQEIGPILLDAFAGLGFIATLIYGLILYKCQIQNQPNSYQELPFVNLTPTHHQKFTDIRNSFRDLNTNYAQIKDVADDLEEIINNVQLPAIVEENIFLLREHYRTIIATLEEEIAKLQEYKINDKLELSTKLANGTSKTLFRSDIYRFFSKCKLETSSQQLAYDDHSEIEDVETGTLTNEHKSEIIPLTSINPRQ